MPVEQRPRPAVLLLLLLLLPVGQAWSGTLFLHDPYPRLCITGEGAQYRVDNGSLQPSLGLFSLFPPGERPLQPRLKIAPAAQPGELLRLYVTTIDALDSVSVEVSTPGTRELTHGIGFRSRLDAGGEQWCVLLGIPSNAVVQQDTLTLRISAGSRSCIFLQPLAVRERAFFFERIPLNGDLSALLATPDPRKTAEYRALLRVLTSPHADAVYETGPLAVPLPGARRTSGYGDRREYDFTDATKELSIHQGVDLAAPTGTPVPACGRGRVVFSGTRILTGNTVVIEHLPGLFSLYFHMSAILVAAGDIVEKGQIVGNVGMTGLATGPHLHWEIEALGISVDPDALTTGPVLDKDPVF
jgi:murein DD-endopeptidase MepM/ murein hydrolase activator NlpD